MPPASVKSWSPGTVPGTDRDERKSARMVSPSPRCALYVAKAPPYRAIGLTQNAKRREPDVTKFFSKKFRGLLAAATMAGLVSFLGSAGIAKSIDLTADQSAAVKEVADYIEGFKTIEGEFTQVS